MQLIGELKNNGGHTVLKMFVSSAKARKDNFRHHKHTEFELSLILSGTGTYKTINKTYDIKKGDIFLFSTNEQHCITDISEFSEGACMQLLNLQFQPSFVWETESDCNYLKIFFDRNEKFENLLQRENAANQDIKNAFFLIKNELLENLSDNYLVIKYNLICCLIKISREFGYINLEKDYGFNAEKLQKIKDALNFINENFSHDITLQDISEKVFMPKTYFCTVFKSLNGITPWEYILIRRVEKAIELLKTTQLTVLAIALSCGFNNTANFNKIFKRITGITPKAYRNHTSTQQ